MFIVADVHLVVPIAIVDCSRIHLVAEQGMNANSNGTSRETVNAKCP
jgi:hypothetical protein